MEAKWKFTTRILGLTCCLGMLGVLSISSGDAADVQTYNASTQRPALPGQTDSLTATVVLPGAEPTRAAQGGDPGCIATGADPSADGYLAFGLDEYGAFSSGTFGGGKAGCGSGDLFNPAGGEGLSEAAFTNGFFLYIAGASQRELLTTNATWKAGQGLDDASLDSFIIFPNAASDSDGDGVDDTLTSTFSVTGTDVDLEFSVRQQVEELGGGVSRLTQSYGIFNFGDAISFDLLRQGDFDLLWGAGDFADDSVGTGTNGLPDCGRFVYQVEDGQPETAITMSSDQGDVYYGSKNEIDPDCGGNGVPFGFGTDFQQWDAIGVPFGWDNAIADVGCDTDGESGPAPAGCGAQCDGAIGLRIPVSLGPGEGTSITITHTYGSTVPNGHSSGYEFPRYVGGSSGMTITGQDEFYIPVPDSQDGLVYTYLNNTLGLPQNPTGQDQFVGVTGGDPGLPVPFARAQRDMCYGEGTGVWTAEFDIAATYLGVLPSAQNIGSMSTQLFASPNPSDQTFIALATWTDPATAENWNADYVWFDAAGTQLIEQVPNAAFQGLEDDHWYHWKTTFNLDTNAILEVAITDLTTGVTTTQAIADRFLFGGSGGATTPTGFRFFAGSATAAGNTLGFDNLAINPAAEPPPCGPCPWDVDGDGFVSAVDLGNLLGGWGCPVAPELVCLDTNMDNCISASDLGDLLGAWGQCP